MTLSNTYLSRKQLLADNLNSMGVLTVDADDGLTTLINAVLDIEPSIGGLDLDTAVSITASESTIIIGQSVVLTSKLTASYDDDTLVDVDLTGVLTGATIQFKEGSTVIGTAVTDNNGVATATISNLPVGTHTIKAVFEGTENFNDCQSSNITITVNNPAPASITVSSDKPIMEKGETATITATVLDSNGNPCEGETVSFEVRKQSDDSLVETLTGATNSSGIATVSYLGKGTGDLNIRANCGITVTDTLPILDTKWYDNPTSSGLSKYTANSGVSISYDSTNEAYLIQRTGSSGLSSVTLNNYRFPNTVTVKADIKLTGISTNHQTGIGLLNNNTGIHGKVCYYSPDSYYAVSLIESTRTSYGANEVTSTDTHLNIQKDKWYTLIVEYNGNNQTVSLYDGDTLIGSVSATKSVLDSSSNEFAIWNGFNSSGNNTYIKNIRIL